MSANEGFSDGIPWWGRELQRRLGKIEDLEPAVLAAQVAILSAEVRELKKAFYTFAFSVVGAAVLFAFTVFALLGHHP